MKPINLILAPPGHCLPNPADHPQPAVIPPSIGKAMEGDVKQAEVMLKRSAVWRAFRNTLGEGTKSQLAAMGPIAWLTQQEGQPVGQ